MFRKISALLLALTMALVSCSAFAETLVVSPGSETGCSMIMFKTLFDTISNASNYSFVWADGLTKEDGYEVYSATSSDGMMAIKVYSKNGNFCYLTGEGEASFTVSSTSTVQKLGEWFGAVLASGVLSVYSAEGGSLDASVVSKFTEALTPLTSAFSGISDDAILKGIVVTAMPLGYPCGLEVSGQASGLGGTLKIRLAVTGPDGSVSGQ